MRNDLTYNLVKEKWIQVIDLNANQIKCSLIELFEEADNIKEVFYESPVEEIAVNRFLQALTIIITGVTSPNCEWEDVYNAGKFDTREVKKYFEKYKECFDLFNKERPFYQHQEILGNHRRNPMTILFQDASSANNACLFDHHKDNSSFWLGLDKIAVGLITAQGYSFGGGISRPTNFRGAPGSSASTFWIKGNNLFESLLLNSQYIEELEEESEPAWEKKLPISEERPAEGYVDYLTWQSRRLKLYLPDKVSNFNYNPEKQEVLCTTDETGFSIGRCQGDFQSDNNFTDPLFALRISKDKKTQDTKEYPYKLKENREAWRDSEIFYSAFYGENPDRCGTPPTIISYMKKNPVISDKKFDINIYTVNNSNGQPKVILWRRVVMPFYPQLMKNDENDKSYLITQMLNEAEERFKKLKGAVYYFAEYNATNPATEADVYDMKNKYIDNKNSKEKEQIFKFATNFNLETDYWASLEKKFYNNLQEIVETGKYAVDAWKDKCKQTASRYLKNLIDDICEYKAYGLANNVYSNNKRRVYNMNTEDLDFIEKLYEIADDKLLNGKSYSIAAMAEFKKGKSNPSANFKAFKYLDIGKLKNYKEYKVDCYLTTATLFALCPTKTEDKKLRLGELLNKISIAKDGENGRKTLEPRVEQLLYCHTEDLPKLLVGMVSYVEDYINKYNIGNIDYHDLFMMLRYWGNDNRSMQKRLAIDFWTSLYIEQTNNNSENNNNSNN